MANTYMRVLLVSGGVGAVLISIFSITERQAIIRVN